MRRSSIILLLFSSLCGLRQVRALPINVATSGAASQSRTAFGGVPARAIDGGNYFDGCVSPTGFDLTPGVRCSWRVPA